MHLEAARLFIDQLEMIREKTRGNLSPEEVEILKNVLSDLQLAFVQATNESAAGGAPLRDGQRRARTGGDRPRCWRRREQEALLEELRLLDRPYLETLISREVS